MGKICEINSLVNDGSRAWIWRFVALMICAVLVSCGGDVNDEPTAKSAIEQRVDRGPVSLVLRLDNVSPTIADRINLQLEVTADESYTVAFPANTDGKLGEFSIVESATTQPELVDGSRTRQTLRLTLEPFLSGDYTIPELTTTFAKEGEEPSEIQTEPIDVTVRSLLASDVENLEIHDIAGPVGMKPPSRAKFWLMLLGIVLVLGAAAGVLIWWLSKQKPNAPPVIIRPAHEIALDALSSLLAEDLPNKGETKEFYSRISDILRRYIENRFGVHAPGQTTEEFLVAQRGGTMLQPEHQQLLAEFLRHCDLVKFAEHQPLADDLRNTIDVTKRFIGETKHVAPTPGS